MSRPRPLPSLTFEDGIDGLENRGRRAEGILEFQWTHAAGGPETVAEGSAHLVEHLGIRALEGVDRLLLVTDDEEPPVFVCGTLARTEFCREPLDHPPLGRARILGLIDEDMVDPAVEPVADPVGGGLVLQQRPCAFDQIVEVEPAARTLSGFIGGDQRPGKAAEGVGSVRRRQAKARPAGLPPPVP